MRNEYFMQRTDARRYSSKANNRAAVRAERKTSRKPGSRRRAWLLIFVLTIVLLIIAPFTIVQLFKNTNQSRIYTSIGQTPAAPVAIVFGAGVQRNGTPSWMLSDRLDSAIGLYKAGKVERLLMTGDNTTSTEVTAMRNYALRQGVPDSAIMPDAAGLRTYDSCYRAYHNYGINRAVLVTQGYHLPRALYLCNSLGIASVGLKAGIEDYPNQEYYNSREFLATFLSWVDITVTQPKPEITN